LRVRYQPEACDSVLWYKEGSYVESPIHPPHGQRALRAEVDEEAWSALYSTVSRPFPAPASGKIAVKVINHYGDEVLKVFDVACH